MRRRVLAALAILLGEPLPHEWTECPHYSNVLTYHFEVPPVDTETFTKHYINDWNWSVH